MFLKRLEITGFKSFADSFEINFKPGITAIVGPNGCGKSNVADALRWVLGSQSPKHLRSERMEDVIFSGSDNRKPLGLAEVIVTFENVKRLLPMDFDEISVIRRLFRAGDSEYLINSTRCRLMDVTNLIVDRGLGSDGYWILEAEMVKTILSSRPEDRRFLFDEAAGIVKYKIQRHRAELKLQATANDLERIDDIVDEVARTVAVLKRQVGAFRRYRKAADLLRNMEDLGKYHILEGIRSRLEELEELLSSKKKEDQDLSVRMSTTDAKLAEAKMGLNSAQTDLDETHRKAALLEAEIAETDRLRAVSEERKNNTESQILQNCSRVEELLKKSSGLLEESNSLRNMAVEIEKNLKDAEESMELSLKILDQKETALQDISDRLKAVRESASGNREKIYSCQQELQDNLRNIAVWNQKKDSLEENRVRVEKSVSELTDELVERKLHLDSQRSERKELAGKLQGNRNKLQKAVISRNTALDTLHEMEVNRSRIQAIIESLAETGEVSSEKTISSNLTVKEGFSGAVGAFLDVFQDARVLEMKNQEELKKDLTEDTDWKEGCRLAISVSSSETRPDNIPNNTIWLSDCIEDDEYGVKSILKDGIVAPDRRVGIELYLKNTGFDIVTPEGDIFRRNGLIRLGIPRTGAGSIEKIAQIENLYEKLSDIERRIQDTDKSLLLSEKEINEIETNLSFIQNSINSMDMELATVDVKIENLETSLSASKGIAKEIDKEIPTLSEKITSIDVSTLQKKIKTLKNTEEKILLKIQLLEQEVVSAQKELGDASKEENRKTYEYRTAQDEMKRCQSDSSRLEEEGFQAKKTAELIRKQEKELHENVIALEQSISEARTKRTELESQRELTEDERRDASDRRTSWLEKIATMEKEFSNVRSRLLDIKQEIAGYSAEQKNLIEKETEIDTKDMNLPDKQHGLWQFSPENLAGEIEKQSAKLEKLGPVNMLAVEEYRESSERLDFLETQKEDLVKARESLIEAIREINCTAAQKFNETFVDVRRNFRELFSRLFDGGVADIIPLEADDPLEGGVQIVARPKGKKLENVSALSGGERALTAVALLFALYLVKPSPFCLLDELDAPLDDSNVDKFVELVKSFSDRTQFIIITHNKRTMEEADRLYGITMAESGVSSLASVKIEDYE